MISFILMYSMVYGALVYSYKNVHLNLLYSYDVTSLADCRIGISKPFFLKTCNRIEMYCYSEDRSSLEEYLLGIKHINEFSKPETGEILIDDKAVNHAFSVASGLDSAVLGENEILGQIRNAFNEYKEFPTRSKWLVYLFENAIRVGRKVRREIKIGDNSGLYDSATSCLLRKYNQGDRIAIVGSGNVVKGFLYNLKEKGLCIDATVFSRKLQNSAAVAEAFGLRYADFDMSLLKGYDIVFSAIKGGDSARIEGPKLVIDMSVPSAFSGDNVVGLEEIIRRISALSSTNRNIGIARKLIDTETARFMARGL